MFKLVLEKAEEPEIKLPTSARSSKKQEFQESMSGQFSSVQFSHSVVSNSLWPHDLQHARLPCPSSTSTLLNMPKPLIVWITTNCGKFFKWWKYQTTWPASWEICMQVKKQQLLPDMEQDWFQIGKEVSQGCISSPYLFNLYAEYIMWNAGLGEAWTGIKTNGEISITSDTQMIPPLWRKAKKN